MKLNVWLAAVIVLGVAPGCVDEVVAPGGTHEESLEFALSFGGEELVTLKEVPVTLLVSNDHGDPVTDIEGVELQYRPMGTTEWSHMEMTLDGSSYGAHHVFTSSGDFEFRAMRGHGTADDHPGSHVDGEMMHQFHDALHIERAHVVGAGHRFEFETFPGQIKEGEEVVLRFWMMEEGGHSHDPVPFTGMDTEIECVEAMGLVHRFPAEETSPGVYEAPHVVEQAGDTLVRLLFEDHDAGPMMLEFHFHVAEAH